MSTATVDANIFADIFGAAGYSADFSIKADELEFLREAIFEQWIARIETAHPESANLFRRAGLQHYHQHAHLVAHSTLWPKEARVLPRDTTVALKGFDFVQRLIRMFGAECRVSDVVFFSGTTADYPEIYWRIVRPGVASDIGGMHTDRWFHLTQGEGPSLFGPDETSVKMWLSIYTEPGLNGLYVVPGSHRREWRVKYTQAADGYPRPSLDEPLADSDRLLVPVAPGQALLFNENLLHGGAMNAGSTTRVSVEITFVMKRAALPEWVQIP
jgi:hypothetical protein